MLEMVHLAGPALPANDLVPFIDGLVFHLALLENAVLEEVLPADSVVVAPAPVLRFYVKLLRCR